MIFVLVALVVFAALLSLARRDFVAPIQMRAAVPCGQGIRLFMDPLAAYPGPLIIYVLLKFVFAIAVQIVVTLVACFTCCCALIPVLHQTLLHPVYYFERRWSFHLLQQMGYDLIGAGTGGVPEIPGPGAPGPLATGAAPPLP